MREVYEGDFRRGARSGVGRHTSASGRALEGTFKDGKLHGRARVFEAKGDFFEGFVRPRRHQRLGGRHPTDRGPAQMLGGLYHGEGRFEAADGSYWYEGEWRRNKPHGKVRCGALRGAHGTAAIAGRSLLPAGAGARVPPRGRCVRRRVRRGGTQRARSLGGRGREPPRGKLGARAAQGQGALPPARGVRREREPRVRDSQRRVGARAPCGCARHCVLHAENRGVLDECGMRHHHLLSSGSGADSCLCVPARTDHIVSTIMGFSARWGAGPRPSAHVHVGHG